jgi:hypothetical protein
VEVWQDINDIGRGYLLFLLTSFLPGYYKKIKKVVVELIHLKNLNSDLLQ